MSDFGFLLLFSYLHRMVWFWVALNGLFSMGSTGLWSYEAMHDYRILNYFYPP